MLTYIPVLAHFDTLGHITPVSFTWRDKEYTVDKVTDVRRAASLIGGGLGCGILA